MRAVLIENLSKELPDLEDSVENIRINVEDHTRFLYVAQTILTPKTLSEVFL